MNSNAYLWAAYIATAVIHGVYLVTLFTRYQKLKRDMLELEQKS